MNESTNIKPTRERSKLLDAELRTLAYEGDAESQAKAKAYEEQVKQFIELRSSGAPKQVIMDALGLTEDDYSKFASREDVKEVVTKAEVSRARTSAVFDDNWDMVENLALQNVARELQLSPDPEFALRAAAVANKAVRRRREEAKLAAQGALAQNLAVNTNNIAILNLSKNFIAELQGESRESARHQLEVQRNALAQQKLHDNVDVAIVKDTFGIADLKSLAEQPLPRVIDGQASLVSKAEANDLIAEQFEEWLNE